jgi:NAD(P)H dehydrogenase (quinone)
MIVVTRGSSPLGRLVVRHLLNRLSPGEIAVTTPDPKEAADLAELGIDVRREHFDDPSSASRVFVDADRVLIISRPGNFGAGLPLGLTIPCADAAIAAGAEHIAYTSIINADGTHHLLHHATEGHLRRSGVPFTFLRNNLESEALLPALQLALATNEFVCSFGNELIAPAARTDYAEAAAIVLTEDRHKNEILKLSGPLGLKPRGIASVMAEIAGKDISVREVGLSDLIPELRSSGATHEVAVELGEIYNDTFFGEWSTATDTLEEVLGHHRLPLVDALRAALGEGGSRPTLR